MAKTGKGHQAAVKRPGKYTSEDVHKALFGSERPVKRTLKELKEGIVKYIRAKHPRRRHAR